MEKYAVAGKGLKTMFLGQILQVIAVVVVLIPLLGWVGGPILSLVGAIMVLFGLYTCMNSHTNFKMAMYMAVVGIVLNILNIFTKAVPVLGAIVSILMTIVSFLEVYFICTAASELLSSKGDGAQAAKGVTVWKLYFICTVVSIICSLVSWIPVLGLLAAVASIIMSIVQFVAYILLLVFYYKAGNALLA